MPRFNIAVIFAIALMAITSPGRAYPDYKDATEALDDKQYQAAAAEFEALMYLGHAKATRQLAQMAAKGQVSAPFSAAALYRLAADQGDPKAAKQAVRLERAMSESELAAVRAELSMLLEKAGSQALRESIMPSSDGLRANPFTTTFTKELEYPLEYQNSHGTVTVDFEFDVDEQGRPTGFELLREAPEGFVREALRYHSSLRFPELKGAFCIPARTVFTRTGRDEQYGAAYLLRKLRKRAEQGSPYRKYYYAFAQELSERLGNQYSDQDSNAWYLKAAQGGYAKAQYIVGQRLLLGWGFDQEPRKGIFWLQQAAQQDNRFAHYFLGRLLIRDPQTEQQGRNHLQQAADAGHATAARYLQTLATEANHPSSG